MNTDNLLMQYQSEALEALKSMTNLGKPFEKVIMDVLKLFMAIPDKINFLQMGRYGKFSEQTYRNTFTRGNFDWFGFNQHLAKKVCTGSFLALAVDPSYIPKSEVGEEDPVVWEVLVRGCRRGQEGSGADGHRPDRCRQPRVHDFRFSSKSRHQNPGQHGQEPG